MQNDVKFYQSEYVPTTINDKDRKAMEKRKQMFPHLWVKNENAIIKECKLAKQAVDKNVVGIIKDLKTLKRLST